MTIINVISSYKLASAEIQSVGLIAKDKLGATGTIKNTVDKSVLAGVKILVDGRELDLTLAGSLTRLAGSLA